MVMLESVASGTLGVICRRPEINAPEDWFGGSSISTGGDSMSKPNWTGLGAVGERGPSRACLSLDNDRSLDFDLSCELCFLLKRDVGRLMCSMLGRRLSTSDVALLLLLALLLLFVLDCWYVGRLSKS